MATITNLFTMARWLVDADSTSFPDAILLININKAYEEIVGKLISVNRSLKFDDLNQTDLPRYAFTLTGGTNYYSIGSTLLTIDRVEILDVSGNWHKLNNIDEYKIDESLSEYREGNGLPDEYSRRGNYIFLYPTPTSSYVTLTNGGRIYYQRTAKVFTSAEVTTGTKEPGFSSPYHYILSYMAALPYAMSYKKDRVPYIKSEIDRMEKELLAIESNKNGDRLNRLISKIESNK